MDFKAALYRRFDRYARVDTQSDDKSQTFPSTKKQFVLAKMLASELKAMGAKRVKLDKYGYVTAELPATVKGRKPVVGLLAHMDTSPDASGKGVKPQLHKAWKGGDIVISRKLGVILNEKNCPPLALCKGDDIVTASGDTLLGADDKAGLAIIMTAAEYLLKHKEIAHGALRIGFTPDEEVGQGVKYFDAKAFGADYAYTFDGDLAGSIEDETFNADSFEIKVQGKSVHPGSAKNAMANAARIIADITSSWPESMIPETTAGREGFIMFMDIAGETEKASATGIVRDHDLKKLKAMERQLEAIVAAKRLKYPLAKIELKFIESYRNMKEIMVKRPEVMDKLKVAVRKAGLEPRIKPVRGGTDGARLSFMGMPTPNVFTGGYNFHGRYEWVSLDGMNKSTEVLLNLVQEWAK
jgi:tripeptide aminopeptidase